MKAETRKVSGGCLCGRIRYQAEIFPRNAYFCHCTVCQKSSGAPAEIGVPIKAGSLQYLKGEPKYFVTSESGKRGFCSECGSRLVWQASNPEDDWLTNLSLGSLDRPAEVGMSSHTFTDTQLPWYQVCEHLPKFAEKDLDALLEFFRQERFSEL